MHLAALYDMFATPENILLSIAKTGNCAQGSIFQDPTQILVSIHNNSTVEALHNFHQDFNLPFNPTSDSSIHVGNTTYNTNNNNNETEKYLQISTRKC